MENGNSRWENFQGKATIFLKKQGFFVVLGLCALCIAIAAAARFLPRGNGQEPVEPGQETTISDDDRLKDVLILPTPVIAAVSPSPSPSPTPKPAATKAPIKGAAPVEGQVVWGFATDSLLYSKTLEQWTTHDGVDIAAKTGTEVHVFLAGEVQRVYVDSALGVSVVVSHDGNLISIYANLAENPPVTEGQKLDAGAIVGLVGETAASECAMETHLHFAVYKDNTAVNPANYILLNKK